jgi:hypothetical protein
MSTALPVADAPNLERAQRTALIAAAVGVVVFLIIAFTPLAGDFPLTQAFTSYLVGYIFWFGVPMGCLVVLMIQYLSGGAWGVLLRPVLEACVRTLPLLAVLFVPVCISFFMGSSSPYPWARPLDSVAVGDALDELKALAWLMNPWFVMGRSVLYYAVFLILAYCMLTWSAWWRRGDAAAGERLPGLSGPGLVFYGVFMTFAAIDWVMSLEPFWVSSIFPPIVAMGQINSGFATATAIIILVSGYPPLRGRVLPKHLRDFGGLLLTFVIFWTYFAFSQFIIIWAGNLPEETTYYLKRSEGGWYWTGPVLIVFRFGVPFLLLLFRDVKDHGPRLFWVAIGILVMQFFDTLWWIEPSFPHEGSSCYWLLDIAAFVAIGGVWVWRLAQILRQTALEPVHGPNQCDPDGERA